jgi:hypothetical protein
LLSAPRLAMVRANSMRAPLASTHATCLSFLLALAAACGSRAAADLNNREIPWKYGPTTGGATSEHVQGAGLKGGPAIAKGWQCRLQDGKRLVVKPYQLASTHPLFGKVTLTLRLFDKAEKPLESVRSTVVTAQNATFTFELTEAVANKLWDVVIWYVAV